MKSKRSWALGVLVAICFGTYGCGEDHDGDHHSEEGEEDVGVSTGALCVSTLTYAADVAPVMAKYCTTCHAKSVPAASRMGAPSNHNFETEDGVLDEAKHVDQEAGSGPNATNTKMPPPASKLPAPTVAERAIISSWLACQGK